MLSVGDIIKITKEYPQKDVFKGDTGTIIMSFEEPTEGYEVEFLDTEGYTKALLTLKPSEFELV